MADFEGFRFGPYHSSDLHLTVVSSSNRFDKNLLPTPNDTTVDIPGANGKYYFGQTFKEREIKVNIAYDSIDEMTFRRIAQFFSTDKLKDLVFDEEPYKTYRAKCKSAPDFKHICFKDPDTGQRIYKGEGTITFVCYHPLAYCFNKYVVTAADYYKCEMPQNIINSNSIHTNRYETKKPKQLVGMTKEHYNTKANMATEWEGGYPTIEQVQWGELYYNENNEKKLLSDVRHYWNNIPKWQVGAQLLTTPTLDYEQELIYMPQYSRVNYYNMDTGLNKQNGLIGSRMLVYNPGDVPVDFTLQINNLQKKIRDLDSDYHFRISRYNVQRLTIEQAVDWTGLKTLNRDEEDTFKYGTKYVSLLEQGEDNNGNVAPAYHDLKNSHPNHIYIAEPIPREKLYDFLMMYNYQIYKKLDKIVRTTYVDELEKRRDEYKEKLENCITEDEKNELYWNELLAEIKFRLNQLNNIYSSGAIFTNDYTIDDYLYDWIYNPLDYILTNSYNSYGMFDFSPIDAMNFFTYDYLEFDAASSPSVSNSNESSCLTIDFSTRMAYNEKRISNGYYETKEKVIYNDNIVAGKWFQIPPGWSLIEITPVLLESNYPGKRWRDARPFKWGGMTNKEKAIYDRCERAAAIKYISENSTLQNLNREIEDISGALFKNTSLPDAKEITDKLESLQTYQIEELLQFRRWYENNSSYKSYINGSSDKIRNIVWKQKMYKIEFGFLKLLNDYWRVCHLDSNGYPTSDAEDWWWYSNNYIWTNYPPIYWTYVDILNQMTIDFTPEYY